MIFTIFYIHEFVIFEFFKNNNTSKNVYQLINYIITLGNYIFLLKKRFSKATLINKNNK